MNFYELLHYFPEDRGQYTETYYTDKPATTEEFKNICSLIYDKYATKYEYETILECDVDWEKELGIYGFKKVKPTTTFSMNCAYIEEE